MADFRGRVFENASLLRPPFSPNGPTAFSIKAGDSSPQDVQQLTTYVSQCQQSADPTLQAVLGGVLVTGSVMTVDRINSILSQGAYCWDTRRLIFYSVKAKKVASNSDLGPVTEHPLRNPLTGGFIFTIHDMRAKETDATADVFVDDHNLAIQGDHLTSILTSVNEMAVRPIVDSMHRSVKLKLSIHALGPIQRTVVEDAYDRYRRQETHSLLLLPVTDLELQSYSTGPWTAIFRT